MGTVYKIHPAIGVARVGNHPTAFFIGPEVPSMPVVELGTDAQGRLLVLGGHGHSESVPPGEDLPEFANNDRWHDDVSDGPVTAVITLAGQEPIVAHHPAWVVVGPPDFAPGIDSLITLYDVAFQAGIDKGALKPEPVPSFRRHIKPLIERAAALRWVNSFNKWNDLATVDW